MNPNIISIILVMYMQLLLLLSAPLSLLILSHGLVNSAIYIYNQGIAILTMLFL